MAGSEPDKTHPDLFGCFYSLLQKGIGGIRKTVNIQTHFTDRAQFVATKRLVCDRLHAIAPEGIASSHHYQEAERLRAWLLDNAEWAEIHTVTDNVGTERLRYSVRCF